MSAICTYYLRGTCRFGLRCWNSHDLNSLRSHSNSFIDLPILTDDESVEESSTSISSTTAAAYGTINSRRLDLVQQQKPNNPVKNQTESLWTLTNNTTGEKYVGEQDTILLEVVKQLSESEASLKTLRQQMRTGNNGENFSFVEHQIEQSLETDLQCNICYELFIKPIVLNCTHTFCDECINSWTRRVNQCPTCRVTVKTKLYCLTLDTFLDKIAEYLPDNVKTRRESIKVERLNNSRHINRKSTSNRRRNYRNFIRRRNRNMLPPTFDELVGHGLLGTRFDILLGEPTMNLHSEWDDDLSDSSTDRFYFLG